MPSVALATCAAFPELDESDRLVVPALQALGIDAVPRIWDDASVDWPSYDLVVIRDTWDYTERRDEFVAWLRRVEQVSRVLNPVDVVVWNTDKRYLRDLAAAGVATVPTQFVESVDDEWLPDPQHADFVVKPAVSAGSRNTARYSSSGRLGPAQRHARGIVAEGGVAMVQPYLDAVDTDGETALLFLGGSYSHAIRKGPLLTKDGAAEYIDGLFLAETIDPREATAQQLEFARRVLNAVPGGFEQLLYARVDLIAGPNGQPLLLELELTEPSLFLPEHPDAPGRLARAIQGRLAKTG